MDPIDLCSPGRAVPTPRHAGLNVFSATLARGAQDAIIEDLDVLPTPRVDATRR